MAWDAPLCSLHAPSPSGAHTLTPAPARHRQLVGKTRLLGERGWAAQAPLESGEASRWGHVGLVCRLNAQGRKSEGQLSGKESGSQGSETRST